MRGSKPIILSLLFLASNAFGLSTTEQISNIVYNVVYSGPTNLPPAMAEETWNFSKLTNMGGAATFRMLRTAGFHLAGSSAASLLTVSNFTFITNFPGVEGSGIFIAAMQGGSNAPTFYITKSNLNVGTLSQYIKQVRVGGIWVSNGATVANMGYNRFITIASKTNVMMAIGDVFDLSGRNFHINYRNDVFQPNIETNALADEYTAEDYLGRTWVYTKNIPLAGGGLTGVGGFGGDVATPGTRWNLGWEFMAVNAMRLYSGPNEYIRTIDGLTQWQPMRSFWLENSSTDAGDTNNAMQFLIQSITVSYYANNTWSSGVYYETNNAKPYGALSLRGNVVTANSGSFDSLSVTNPPTQPTNVVNLAALQNSLRTNGAVGFVTQTNFNLLQIYTNSSGLVQAYSGRIGLATAGVNGNAGVLAFLSRDNGATFSAVGGVSIGTTIGITLAQTYTNGFNFYLNTNDQCYFTNISSGGGDTAGLVAGSGQVTLMGASIASTLTNQNSVTAQYLVGDTNLLPTVYTNYVNGGATLTTVVHSNASPTSFTISVSGTGTAIGNTNQFGVNFGRTFSIPPRVFMQFANGQMVNQNCSQGNSFWHPSHNSITESNFNVMGGATSQIMSTTLSNVYEFLVIGQ